jgi:hypothetical protein
MRAAWAAQGLDHQLAEGADPEFDQLLRVRSEQLVMRRSRDRLAAGLERVVASVDEPVGSLSAMIPARRDLVGGARHELMGLAGDLRHMPSPRPRGVALAERLLTQPDSPLFTAVSSDDIARAARAAAASMQGAAAPRAGRVRATVPVEHRFSLPTVTPVPSQRLDDARARAA